MESRWHCRQDSRMGVGEVERELDVDEGGGVVGMVSCCILSGGGRLRIRGVGPLV